MKAVYICSPLHGDIVRNIQKATCYCRTAAELGYLPLAPHTIFTRFLNDDIPDQRQKGLGMGLELMKRCDELWICGNVISQGMRGEIKFARENGIPIENLNEVTIGMDHLQNFHTEKSDLINYYDLLNPDDLKEYCKLSGLGEYPRILPLRDSHLPYFVLDRNDYCRFAYCPAADDKFALLIHNDYGKTFQCTGGRMYGGYSNKLESLLDDVTQLNIDKIMNVLCDFEPNAVYAFEEKHIFKKMEQMTEDTGARPFVFIGECRDISPIVSLPEEIKNYLTPEETELAKKIIAISECAEAGPPVETEAFKENPEEDFEPEMSM